VYSPEATNGGKCDEITDSCAAGRVADEVGQWYAQSHCKRADAPATAAVPLVAVRTRPLRAIGPSTIEPDVTIAIRNFYERLNRVLK
jgi:hypothetical protein